ncbi:MAG: hypothetical protein U0W65_01465 [Bacteroidia bacterium]
MKNQIIIIIVSILLNNQIIGQTLKDSVIFRNNEIGIDLKPVLQLFGDLEPHNKPTWQLFYKRKLHSHIFLRFNAMYNPGQKNNIFTQVYFLPLDSVKDALSYNKNIKGKQVQFSTGIEYKYGRKRLKQFVGLDIGYMYFRNTELSYYGLRTRSEPHNPNDLTHDVSLTNNHLNPNNTYQDSIVNYIEIKNNCFIIKPVYGLQFHFSKHLFFSTQVGIPLSLVSSTYNIIINNNSTQYYNRKSFDIDAKNLINNFSLVYSF